MNRDYFELVEAEATESRQESLRFDRGRFEPRPVAVLGPCTAADHHAGQRRASRMVITLKVDCAGKAFEGPRRDHEVARVLKAAADKILTQSATALHEFSLVDSDGKDCGLLSCQHS